MFKLTEELGMHSENVFFLVKLNGQTVGAVKNKDESISAMSSLAKKLANAKRTSDIKVFIESHDDNEIVIYSQYVAGIASYIFTPPLEKIYTISCEAVGVLIPSV